MKRVLALALLLVSCGGISDERPNVVLIVVDTLRADRLACYGCTTLRTPAFDRLAREGVRFDAAFAQAALTLPSICSIMTSRYPYRHQVRNNETNLHDRFVTMAEVFRTAGYATGAVVGSTVMTKARNLTQGFQFYEDQFPESLVVHNEARRDAGHRVGDRLQRRASDVTNIALDWIRDNRQNPFFLFAHYFDPHSAYDPPPPFSEQYDGRPYDGEVACTDGELGRLLSGIDELGLTGNTLVVLVADHGEGLWEHSEPEHGFFVYDTTIRIPLLMRMPGTIPAGSVVLSAVASVDIYPTVMELAGLGVPGEEDGSSLLPRIRGKEGAHVPVYSEAFLGYFGYGWSPARSVRTAEWKFIHAPLKELYNLADDPKEERNLYTEDHKVASRLEAILSEHLEAEKRVEALDGIAGAMTAAQKQRLQALGYLSNGGRDTGVDYQGLPDPKVAVQQFNNRQMSKVLLRQANLLCGAGRSGEAIPVLEQILTFEPNSFAALVLIFEIYYAQGRVLNSDQFYRQARGMKPENGEDYSNYAVLLVNTGHLEEGIAAVKKAIRFDSDDPRHPALLQAIENALASGEEFHVGVSIESERPR